MAFLSRAPLTQVRSIDFSDPGLPAGRWRHRLVLAGRNKYGWFCSVHAGWGTKRTPSFFLSYFRVLKLRKR